MKPPRSGEAPDDAPAHDVGQMSDMHPLTRRWGHIGEALGLDVSGPVEIRIGAAVVRVPVLVRGFGAPNGMLVTDRFDDVRHFTGELVRAGFGYSVMSAGGPEYDREATIEVLSDWGWAGDPDRAPEWLGEAYPESAGSP